MNRDVLVDNFLTNVISRAKHAGMRDLTKKECRSFTKLLRTRTVKMTSQEKVAYLASLIG